MFEDRHLRNELESAFLLVKERMLDSAQNPTICSLHSIFSIPNNRSHNCVACNLADFTLFYSRFFERLLKDQNLDIQEVILDYTIKTYFLTERIDEILNVLELPQSYKSQYFSIISRTRKWANFFKHPKAFLFVHHPTYCLESLIAEAPFDESFAIINTDFIETFYSSPESNSNSKLIRAIRNNSKVIVIFPSIVQFTSEIADATQKFIQLIETNLIFQERLKKVGTIENYYEQVD